MEKSPNNIVVNGAVARMSDLATVTREGAGLTERSIWLCSSTVQIRKVGDSWISISNQFLNRQYETRIFHVFFLSFICYYISISAYLKKKIWHWGYQYIKQFFTFFLMETCRWQSKTALSFSSASRRTVYIQTIVLSCSLMSKIVALSSS